MKQIKATDIALLVLRVVAGVVIVYFGSQKVLGVFGGAGIQATVASMKESHGIPMPLAYCAMAGEFLGGLGLIFGVLTRLAAFGVCCTTCVATYVNASAPNAFAAIVAGNPADSMSKVAFPLLIATIAFAILLMGGGRIALDSRLFRKKAPK